MGTSTYNSCNTNLSNIIINMYLHRFLSTFVILTMIVEIFESKIDFSVSRASKQYHNVLIAYMVKNHKQAKYFVSIGTIHYVHISQPFNTCRIHNTLFVLRKSVEPDMLNLIISSQYVRRTELIIVKC